MSSELQWQLLRSNNCFIVKRNGYTFSREPGNLTGKHSFKYSTLANTKAIGVEPAEGKGVKVVLQKKDSLNKPSKRFSSWTVKSGVRRVAKTVLGITNKGYRKDLEKAALAKATILVNVHKSHKPVKTGRVTRNK